MAPQRSSSHVPRSCPQRDCEKEGTMGDIHLSAVGQFFRAKSALLSYGAAGSSTQDRAKLQDKKRDRTLLVIDHAFHHPFTKPYSDPRVPSSGTKLLLSPHMIMGHARSHRDGSRPAPQEQCSLRLKRLVPVLTSRPCPVSRLNETKL